MRSNLAPGCISSDVKLCQRKPLFPFFWDPFFRTPCFLFFFVFFLALRRLARLKCNLEPNCCAYLGVIILQPHASTQRFRLRILRRTRSFPGRTSARSLSGRIEPIWKTPSKERACCPPETKLGPSVWSTLRSERRSARLGSPPRQEIAGAAPGHSG